MTMKYLYKNARQTHAWTIAGLLTTFVLPAAFAILPGIRKRYGMGVFSVPSLALMGGLWLWQKHLEKKRS